MGVVLPAHLHVRPLYDRLVRELAALGRPVVVGDGVRAFLQVSFFAVTSGLYSLEFAFDEDDGRTAFIEARFAPPSTRASSDDLPGFRLSFLLPRILPKYTAPDASRAHEDVLGLPRDGKDVVARFVTSLSVLGSYRHIEAIASESIETELL